MTLFVGLGSFAQKDDLNINWGELYKTRPTQSMGEIFGYDETGYYTYQSSPMLFTSDPFVEKYDGNFNKTASNMWTAKKSADKVTRKRTIEAFLMVGDKLVAISSMFDRKAVQRKLYWETLDKTTMIPNDDAQLFAAMDMESKSIFRRADVKWTNSTNQGMYAFYSEIPRKFRGNEQMYVVKVVDKDLNEQWQHTIRLPYSSALFNIKETLVDEKGNFYILGFNRFSPGRPWGSFQLITVMPDGNVTNNELNLPSGRYMTSLHMEEANNGDVICMGFYSDKINGTTRDFFGNYSSTSMYQNKGVFRGKLRDGQIVEMKNYDFPHNYVVQNFDKNSRRREALRKAFGAGSGEAQSFKIRDLLFDTDGSSYMTAEQYVHREVTTTDAYGNRKTTHYYYYNDIMVVKYDKDGNVLWMKKQPKGQMTTNDNGYYSSYTARLKDGNVYILYNDNIKNYEGKKKDVMTYGSGFKRKVGAAKLSIEIKTNPMLEALRKDMCVSVLKFDKDGNMSKEMMFTAKENGAILVPKVTNDDLDKWIIYSKRDRKERIGEVQIK